MSLISRLTTWASNQLLTAASLNGEFNNVVNVINNLDSGTTKWDVISVLNTTTVPLTVDNSTGSQDIVDFKANGTTVAYVNSTGVFKAVGIVGTTTNDSAASGNVGQYLSASVSSNVNFPASATYGDLLSISLTAGDWDVSAAMWADVVGTWSNAAMAIGTVSGNSQSGFAIGDNQMQMTFTSTSAVPSQISMAIPSFRVSIASTTTYYLKYSATWATTAPIANGRISARRIR